MWRRGRVEDVRVEGRSGRGYGFIYIGFGGEVGSFLLFFICGGFVRRFDFRR